MKTRAAAIAILLAVTPTWATSPPARPINTYHIGNSLTWDLQPKGLVEISARRGYLHTAGYHIRCGMPLIHIWTHPEETCVDPVVKFGTFRGALKNHAWDAVTIQPHRGASTLGEDEAVILDMIALARENPANKDTRFFIHCAWPGDSGADYAKQWLQPIEDKDDAKTVLCRQYFDHLIRRVRAGTEAQVYAIPAGEVLYALDQKLRAGALPGAKSVEALYRDKAHLTTARGRFAMALTAWSTLFRTDPKGMRKPQKAYGKADAYSDAYYQLVWDTAWSVVKNHHHTGLTPGKAKGPVKLSMAMPEGWSGETIKLPPSFAPDMSVKGTEVIRFAPGMFKADQEDFFSYALVFYFPDRAPLDHKTIHAELLKYYRGLASAVGKGRGRNIDTTKFELAYTPVPDKPGRYTATLNWVEPFVTGKAQALHFEVESAAVPGTGGCRLSMSASPQTKDHKIWAALRNVLATTRFSSP